MPNEKIVPVFMLATIGIAAITGVTLQSQCDNFEDGCTVYVDLPDIQVSLPQTSSTPVPSSEPFRLAVNKAMSAARLVQTAKTSQTWQLVTIQWQEAIDLMRVVPGSSPKYGVAQQKVVEYQTYLEYAQAQMDSGSDGLVPEALDGTALVQNAKSSLKNLGITRAAFDQLEVGMSYAAVKAIVGKAGKELNRFEMPGVLTVVMYQWQSAGGANIYAMFEDGKLTNKNQFGLE